jgi:drug/metabolite transporter (DMT)-like permease
MNDIVELLLLAAIWGASFLFMRIGAPELGPIPLIALRVGIAALVLAPVLRSAVARTALRRHALPLLIVGITNSALPFCLLAYSTLYVSAGFDSILNATTPLWAALTAFVLYRVSINRPQALGMLVGLAGVAMLVWNKFDGGAAGVPSAVGAALLATLSYGFAVNYAKRHLAGVPPLVAALGSQLWASVVLAPLAVWLWPATAVGQLTWGCVVALGVVCTGFAYILYFRLIERAGASFAASVTLLIPVFGVVWGALFLGEAISASMLAGCVVILFGTALATGKLGFVSGRKA